MSGNRRAQDFYEAHGYAVAEQVLYGRLEPGTGGWSQGRAVGARDGRLEPGTGANAATTG